MRYDEAHWRQGLVDIHALDIDLNNPRFAFRHLGGIDGVVKYMVEKEGVLVLAAQIADYGGLFANERIIVLEGEEGRYTVLEGNRRTLACQILLHPGKYFPDDDVVATIPVVDNETRARIGRLDALIALDRRAADPIVARIHVFGKKDWNFLSRMYYAYNSFQTGTDMATICASLGCSQKDVYHYVRAFTAIDLARESVTGDFTKIDLLLGGEVDPQHFLGIVLSPLVQRHFGAPFVWDNGEKNFLGPHSDLIEKVGRIARDTLFSTDGEGSRILRGGIDKYLKAVFPQETRQLEMDVGPGGRYVPSPDPPLPPVESSDPGSSTANPPAPPPESPRNDLGLPSIGEEDSCAVAPSPGKRPPDIEVPSDEEEGSGGQLPVPAPKSREVFFEALECPLADFRLQQITKEIVSLSRRQRGLIDFAISASFLMRALLEWSLLYHCTRSKRLETLREGLKKPPGFEPTLTDLLDFFSKLKEPAVMPKRLGEKCGLIRDRWLIDLNCNAHNSFGNHTAQRLTDIAADVRPVIRFIFSGEDASGES